MRKAKITIFSFAFLFAAFFAGMIAYAADEGVTVEATVTYNQTEARRSLDLVNEFRTGSEAWYWNSDNKTKTVCTDLSPLVYDYDLEKVAMDRAAEIAVCFSHTRPDTSSFESGFSEYGVDWTSAGENLGGGYNTVESAVEAWKETDEDYDNQGHRRNMLYEKFNAYACACVCYNGGYYWVQEFACTTNKSTKTAAYNKTVTVSIFVSSSLYVSVEYYPDPKDISLLCGESVSLPAIMAKIEYPYWYVNPFTWGYGFGEMPCTWTVSDTSCAVISGGKLVAKSAGEVKLTAKVQGKTYTVPVSVKKDLSKCDISLDQTSVSYDGNEKEPGVTVKDGSTTLKNNTDYTLSYSNNEDIGTATVTIRGIGNYSGTVTKTFKIEIKKGAIYKFGDYVYKITDRSTNGKGTITVTGTTSKKLKSATIPDWVHIGEIKFKVTKISSKAFKGCTKLKSVTVGKYVTTIGNQAFSGCTKLNTVTVGKNVTTIGKKVFYNCKKLKTITIKSKKLTSVGEKAFKGINSKATITVPKSKLRSYKKLLKGKGQGSKVTITKN